jgi:hypothetical protein
MLRCMSPLLAQTPVRGAAAECLQLKHKQTVVGRGWHRRPWPDDDLAAGAKSKGITPSFWTFTTHTQ